MAKFASTRFQTNPDFYNDPSDWFNSSEGHNLSYNATTNRISGICIKDAGDYHGLDYQNFSWGANIIPDPHARYGDVRAFLTLIIGQLFHEYNEQVTANADRHLSEFIEFTRNSTIDSENNTRTTHYLFTVTDEAQAAQESPFVSELQFGSTFTTPTGIPNE
tara:strand:- start:5250 stop:5735 length:486 start_codon:yes stop_codon:yes gene_type:complete